jgi:hypothetical protein
MKVVASVFSRKCQTPSNKAFDMAKKAARRKTATNRAAPRKAAPKKAAPKKAAPRKAAGRPEAQITFVRGRGEKGRPNQAKPAVTSVRRGNRNLRAEVIQAGQATTKGRANVARTQSIKKLNADNRTSFFDKQGNRVSAQNAATKKGNLRSGFQAQRTEGGRRLVLTGGGQSG